MAPAFRDIPCKRYKAWDTTGNLGRLNIPLESVENVSIDLRKTGLLYYTPKYYGFQASHEVVHVYDGTCPRATLMLQQLRNISLRMFPREAEYFWGLTDAVRDGSVTADDLHYVLSSGLCRIVDISDTLESGQSHQLVRA